MDATTTPLEIPPTTEGAPGSVVDLVTNPQTPGLDAEDRLAMAVAAHIRDVIADCPALVKDGLNRDQGWKFISFDQMVAAAGPAMRAHGVSLLPPRPGDTEIKWETIPSYTGKRPTRVAFMRSVWRLVTPSGVLPIEVYSEGADNGDKAITKAYTYARRSAFEALFEMRASIEPAPGPSEAAAHDPESATVDIEEARMGAVIGRKIVEAHRLADDLNDAALRGMGQATADLAGERVVVDAWWTDHTEIHDTTFHEYLRRLWSEVVKRKEVQNSRTEKTETNR